MTIQDVKQIKLADYLQSLGYTPVKQQGRNLWYKSPLREETDASFKVNTELEKWYDFGIGKGGNIIALAAELYHSGDVAYLLKRIEERTAYIRPASFSFGRQHSDNQPYQGLRVGELSSPALIAYLQERGINIGLAKRECRELRFMNADKPYFAIGFPNMAGAVSYTHLQENKQIYDQLEMGKVEGRWMKTTDGKQMLTWVIYPCLLYTSRCV